MLKHKLAELLAQAALEAQKSGKLPPVSLPELTVEHPQNPEHGDYASSLPLKLARATSVNPLAVAGDIIGFIAPAPEVERITVAPPGFINFTLKSDWLTRQVDTILEAGDKYGDIDLGRGQRVQIEFVSVNPTGYRVEKEYYINDAGNQVEAFARSLYARYQQALDRAAPMPEEGYFGQYMVDLAGDIVAEYGDRFLSLPEPEAISQLGKIGVEKIIGQIKADLESLEVSFDVWFSERSLYERGQYQEAMSLLGKEGHLSQREGATWFISTALGEDKDNVVVRSDGSPTYFATDIAYHYDKFVKRQFDTVINIWGADHMGHVSRMKAVVGALGIDPERLKVIISQMVTLRRGGEIVKVSKRSGDIVTLRELVDEVGKDVCRFFFLCRSADSQMDFDLELAKKQSADNPVYYVQYAHARIASILRLAQERGIDYQDGDVSLLTTEPELTLIRKMLLLPELTETISATLEPHHLTYYAQDLATVFHSFYKQCRVVSKDETLSKARLKLVKAAKTVLARTLNLMGMAAPEKM
jgi:arginyl-tRNA synthetase